MKRPYISGYFCYAKKVVVVANVLGIVYYIEHIDSRFKQLISKCKLKNAQVIPKLIKKLEILPRSTLSCRILWRRIQLIITVSFSMTPHLTAMEFSLFTD